jgi:cyclophilin family peptidyl-prolyl cis-trans isomerase
MSILRARCAVVMALFVAALVGQDGKPKKPQGKGEKAPKVQLPGPEKDDLITKKDKVVAALDKFLAAHAPNSKQSTWRTQLSEPPLQTFLETHDYFWHLATNKGELRIRLLPTAAPMHCTSAIYLSRAGFYDGLTFHRVIKGFMAQGGCPNGSGSGNAGYTMAAETSAGVKHDKAGLISTANEDGKEKTDGSQFFLTFAATPHLDGKHTIFGEVVAGMDVVAAIDALGGEGDVQQPSEPITIVRAWICVQEREGEAVKDEDKAAAKGDSKPTKKQGPKPLPRSDGKK